MTYVLGYERNKYLIFGVLLFLFIFSIYANLMPPTIWGGLIIATGVTVALVSFREMIKSS